MRTQFLIAGALLALATAAHAQPAPTAADIINSLKPSAAGLTAPTRGIRPASTPSAAPTAAPAEPAEAPSINLTVSFKTGSAGLTQSAEHTLDALGHALTSPDLKAFRFRVEGHTDTVGKPDTNRALSQSRADAVAAYLEKKFAIDASRLQPAGVGSDQLLVPTGDQVPEARNRAVKVVNLGA